MFCEVTLKAKELQIPSGYCTSKGEKWSFIKPIVIERNPMRRRWVFKSQVASFGLSHTGLCSWNHFTLQSRHCGFFTASQQRISPQLEQKEERKWALLSSVCYVPVPTASPALGRELERLGSLQQSLWNAKWPSQWQKAGASKALGKRTLWSYSSERNTYRKKYIICIILRKASAKEHLGETMHQKVPGRSLHLSHMQQETGESLSWTIGFTRVFTRVFCCSKCRNSIFFKRCNKFTVVLRIQSWLSFTEIGSRMRHPGWTFTFTNVCF